MKILITGAEGQLGHELCRVFKGNDLIPLSHKEGDITQTEIIQKIEKARPDLVIHGAAYTDVDGCENDPDYAYLVNALGTRNVVLGAQRVGAELVYISSDYVFDGKKGMPYLEFDETGPINVYGRSKLAGEWYVQHLSKQFFIVRSSWLYGVEGKNFVKTILKLAKEKDILQIVNDQIGCPTFVKDVAKAIFSLMQTRMYGIYHAAAGGNCSWFDFACKILKIWGINIKVEPISSKKLKRFAQRPSYSVLKNFCLSNLGIKMKTWEIGLLDFYESQKKTKSK
jgi:dTDP-4-dehydrorhamnose reductase